MKYTNLPNTNIKVSKICLGTMNWGNQNTEAEGHAQMDYALDQGINFFDTAELYPVPATAESYGRTSEIIGNWFKKTGNRDKIILATKIAGPGDYTAHIRTTGFSKEALNEAVNLELKRLQTDYIDLYQLHWPEGKPIRLELEIINITLKIHGRIISMKFCIIWMKLLNKVKYVTLEFPMKKPGEQCDI